MMTNTCLRRQGCRGVVFVLALLLGNAAMAQSTGSPPSDGLKRLQQQQKRDSQLRQQSIVEQQRQQSVKTRQKAVRDPLLQSQVDAANRAQYRQYRERRTDLIDHSRNLPRPGEAPVTPPVAPPAHAATVPPRPPAPVLRPAPASSSARGH
jgi:hypothetical protein